MRNINLGGALAAVSVMALGVYRMITVNDMSAYLCLGAGAIFMALVLLARRPRP